MIFVFRATCMTLSPLHLVVNLPVFIIYIIFAVSVFSKRARKNRERLLDVCTLSQASRNKTQMVRTHVNSI